MYSYFEESVVNSLIFSVDGRTDLVDEINKQLLILDTTIVVGEINTEKFSDGEVCSDYLTSVRGKRIYLVSSPNTAEKREQLDFAIDAAKRAGAKEIIPVLPYFPYARQDKKDQARGPIGAKVMAERLENRGATSIITFDLHADQIQGFFNIPVMHMEGKYLFDRYIFDLYRDHLNDNIVLCAPDAGAAKRVKGFRDQLNKRWNIDLPMVHIDKTRKKASIIDKMIIIGEVRAKDVIIIDDMCDTGGTLVKAAQELIDAGAKSVRAIVTHGVLSGKALERLWDAKHDEIMVDFVCSDSLPVAGREFVLSQGVYPKAEDFITIISTAKQIVKGIIATERHTSIEHLKGIE
jgi:ribose-phosphate pyrophosphokinase